jgi:hypothetical protein
MAKLTAAQERSIETVLYHLQRAQEYINKDSTVLASKKSHATTTLDFLLPDGTPATQVAKDIGSDLAGLSMGIEYLKNFLKFHAKEW